MALILNGLPCLAQLNQWLADDVTDFSGLVTAGVQVHPDSLIILDVLDEDKNLALGSKAVDEYNKEVPLSDGSIALQRSEWISGTPSVFGRYFTLDLGFNRAINRIKVLVGETAVNQPEYFIRGYRLEAASEQRPKLWRLLAEESLNARLNIDTSIDSTWAIWSKEGEVAARIGRFVRLTIIRQDRSNWVSLGDIEVFGTGYVDRGRGAAEFTATQPVNIGRIRWQAETGPETRLQLQLRDVGRQEDLTVWDEAGIYRQVEVLFSGEEPVNGLQYRVLLETDDPRVTPALKRLEIDYDPVLVASSVTAQVDPDTVSKGVVQSMTYTMDIEVNADDYGVDMLRVQGAPLTITTFRINGGILEEGSDFTWTTVSDGEGLLIELTERVEASAHVEIGTQGLFLFDLMPLEAAVGNKRQAARDGYVNWQNGRPASGATWVVRALGLPTDLIGSIDVGPRPFSPFQHEALTFEFVVGNLEEVAEVKLAVFELTGQPVRKMVQEGRARAYTFAWDGRDENGRIAAPGLYVYEIWLDLGESSVKRRGTLVVAY